MDQKISLVWFLVVLQLVTYVQTQTPSPTPSTTRKPPSRRGIVLTVMKNTYTIRDTAQIRCIPAIPFYDSWDGMVPGLKFSNSDIHFLSVDVDYQTKNLYLYDYHLKSIAIGVEFNPDLDLDNMTFEFMHAGVSKATVQVAYDWLSRTLYWVDPGFGWIIAVPGNKSRIDEDLYKIIVKEDMDKPDGIAVDPHAGLLFWSDNGITKKIERSTLMGVGRRTIVSRNLVSPRALEVDHLSKRLYWIDNRQEEINSVNYDGSDPQLLRRIAGSSLFDFAIYQDMVIISDISDGRIYFLNKTSGKSMYSSIRIGSEITYGIAVYSEDNQPPKNNDHCLTLKCPHLCLSTSDPANPAECVCSEGFEYVADNNTCMENVGSYHRAVILLTTTDICYGDIRSLASYSYNATCVYTSTMPAMPLPTTPHTTVPGTSTYAPPTSGVSLQPDNETILFMDIDMEERVLYFASERNIYSRSLDQTTYGNIKTSVTSTNLNISGLVYDWIDRYNLYYSTTIGYIYVKNVKDTSVKRLFTRPSGVLVENLVLLPHERKLAWTSTSYSISKIECANLTDGPIDPVTIIGGRQAIRSLTYDQHSKTFYWIESYYVYKYTPGGSQTTPVLIHFNTDQSAFYLQVYKNSLLVAQTLSNSTYTYFRTSDLTSTASLKKVTASGTFRNLPGVTHFKILDTELQPPEESFCKNNNGNCEQICLTTHDGYGTMQKRCDCGYGFKLAADGLSCRSEPKTDRDFLLVSDWTSDQINQVPLDTGDFHAVDIDRPGTPKALLYNHFTDRVIFSLEGDDEVYAAKLNATGSEVFVQLDYYTIPNRFALDETTGNIYYTTTYYDYMGVITPERQYIELTMDELYLADVQAIVLHPERGFMYFSVHDFTYSYIGRAAMDGSNFQKLIQSSSTISIRWPDGLAIDYTRNHLYWADRYYDTIYRCDLDGRNCTLVLEDKGADINDIQTDGQFLYYTTYGRGLFKVNLNNFPYKWTKVGNEIETGRLGSLVLYRKQSPNKQPVSDGCKANGGKGPCSTICLPKPYGKYTCRCNINVDLKEDEKTCNDVFQCPVTLGNAQSPSSCSRYADSYCDMECKPGYMKADYATNMTVYCSRVGWNIPGELCVVEACPLTIDNGNFIGTCMGKVGDTCSYGCAAGYTPTKPTPTVQCLTGPRWDINDQFCKETKCPTNVITNGAFKSSCDGKISSICDYTCNQYYIPALSPPKMTCLPSGVWNGDVTTACIPVTCPATITNGAVFNTCDRAVGSTCIFNCSLGYQRTVDEIMCTSSGEWSPTSACKRMSCPVSIQNGAFVNQCTGEFGTTCSFICMTPNFKSNITASSLTCGTGGQWMNGQTYVNTNTLCIESCANQFQCNSGQCIPKEKVCDGKADCDDQSDEGTRCVACPDTISNGNLLSCDGSVGKRCNYTCDTGYHKTEDTIICVAGGTWHAKTPCQEIECPLTIENGKISQKCTTNKPGESCKVVCNDGFELTRQAEITCLETGEWNATRGLCTGIILKPVTQPYKGSSGLGSGATAGIVVAVILLLIIVALVTIFILYKRRLLPGTLTASPSAKYSTSDIAIENPGYMNSDITVTDDTRQRNHYDNANEYQPTGFSNRPDRAGGYENPMYRSKVHEEPLPEQGDIGIDQENAVLTTDSWQREQLKGPEA